MRTLVDIPQLDLEALDRLGQGRKASRAKLIREAIRDFLTRNRNAGPDEAFGLWRDQAVDGLVYQRKIRSEW